MFEIEIKAWVRDPMMIEGRLKNLGGKEIRTERQRDIYFNAPHRNFKQTDEVLRIRELFPGEHVVTYKGPRITKVVKTREELEVSVEDGEVVKQILEKLGFKRIVIVEKERQTYALNNFLVNLDRVKNLETFIEIETKAENLDERKKLKYQIHRLLDKLGVPQKDIEKKTYLELMLKSRKDCC